MRIIYPYVSVFQESVAALAGRPVEMVDTSADGEAYWRLLSELWASGDDFCIIEQDMVPAPGVLSEIEACPKGWCGEPYLLYGNYGVWHGVTRYRGSFTAEYADVPERIVNRYWDALDSAWINHLRVLGPQEAHWHWPVARHLRETPDLTGRNTNFFLNCPGCGAPLPYRGIAACPSCGQPFVDTGRTPTASIY